MNHFVLCEFLTNVVNVGETGTEIECMLQLMLILHLHLKQN